MTLDQLAEQAANRIANESLATNRLGLEAFATDIIREALEAATQAQRELLEHVRKERDEARFRPLGDNHHNAASCPYCNPKLEAQREQLEQAREMFGPLPGDAAFSGDEPWTDLGWTRNQFEMAKARITSLEQQLSRVTQERDERFTEAEVRVLLKTFADETIDGVVHAGWFKATVDRLLAEHKAQQSCATPTKSSPPARVVDAPSSAGG